MAILGRTDAAGWFRPAWGAIFGAMLGFLLLHPYVMLLGFMGVDLPHHPPANGWDLKAFLAVEGSMAAMAAPLALFGAATGLLMGISLNRAHHLRRLLLEREKSLASLEAVRALTATLSHYLLNANMIIGGKVRHCRKLDPGEDILECLRVIEEQGRTIDAVVGSLRDATQVIIQHGTANQVPMIDLTQQLEERLRRLESDAEAAGKAG